MSPQKSDPAAFEQLPQNAASIAGNVSSPDLRQEVDVEVLNYQPVPPRKGITLSVLYRVRGRGRPLPYALNEGDDG